MEDWAAVLHSLPPHIRNTNGSVIITTQLSELSQRADLTIPLFPLDNAIGGAMLLHYLEHSKLDEPPDVGLAQEVSEFVGGLPVATRMLLDILLIPSVPWKSFLRFSCSVDSIVWASRTWTFLHPSRIRHSAARRHSSWCAILPFESFHEIRRI